MENTSEDLVVEQDYGKVKIFYLNIFIILLKAISLSPYKWYSDMDYINTTLGSQCGLFICHRLLINAILLLLLMKLFFGYVTLAANIIAIFPILTDDMPNLLIPSVLSLGFENIVLTLFEFLIGCIANKYYANGRWDNLVAFSTSIAIKIALAMVTLNIYAEFYHKIIDFMDNSESIYSMGSEEKIINSQSLTYT